MEINIKEQLKHLEFGVLHLLVALTSILFVSGLTGVPVQISFIAVGFGTLIFHVTTNNKLSSVLGLSASYLAGVTLVMQNYGLAYVKGGVILVGVIYLLISLLLKLKPNLLSSIPQYIFQLAVLFIALLLIPIGFGMMNTALGYLSIVLLVILYLNKRTQSYAMPITLVIMGIYSYFSGQMIISTFEAKNLSEWILVAPKFNLYTLTTISLVSLAAIGELFGDVSKTADINNVDFGKDITWKQVFLGNGLANILAGLLGSNPTTSYTENNGFLLSVGHDDLNPTAQVYTGILFILLAFITPLIGFLQSIPLAIFGALLTFLFVNLGFDSVKTIKWNKKKSIVAIVSFIGFVYTYKFIPSISPITISFAISLLINYLYDRIVK